MRLMIALMLWLNPLPPGTQPRFPAPLDLCAMVDADLVKRLVPGGGSRLEGRHCVWTKPGSELVVRWVNDDGEPWDYTSAQAHEEYRRSLARDLSPDTSPRSLWVNGEFRDLLGGRARVVRGVGDEGYLLDHVAAGTERVDLVKVVFRVGNLLVEVEHFGPAPGAVRLRQGAVAVARRMADALVRASPADPAAAPVAPGTYAESPIACAVLSPAQVRQLVEPSAYARAGNSATCSWEKPNESSDRLQLRLEFWAPRRGPAGDGVAQAKEMFAGWRDDDTRALDLADEALAFREGTPQVPGPPVVVFRKANLLGYVRAGDEAKAERAARWIVEALS
ncbi:hypothetical protein [Nonomuraea sp. NPDC023979]|uniref:hypothetical protein n=1 Tax=Nonomuraea sp. NPDC023979 TaxID=3154796 RepID=UPI0033C4997B